MFEDAVFESAGTIHTRSRAWSLAALALNTSILAALIAIPLLYPESLPPQMRNILLFAPPAPTTPVRIEPQRPQASPRSFTELIDGHMFAPRRIPAMISILRTPEAPLSGENTIPGSLNAGAGDNPAAIFRGSENRGAVVQATPTGPITISRGVAEGMLLQKVVPRYPPIAIATRTQGTVQLQAVISKEGRVENLRVVSGSPMLTRAALDAVNQWRYRPYLLNGEPVAVETTINVVFTFNP